MSEHFPTIAENLIFRELVPLYTLACINLQATY